MNSKLLRFHFSLLHSSPGRKREENAKTEVAATVVGCEGGAKRRTTELGRRAIGTAASNLRSGIIRGIPNAAIDRCALVIIMPIVRAPFPSVAMGIEKSKVICGKCLRWNCSSSKISLWSFAIATGNRSIGTNIIGASIIGDISGNSWTKVVRRSRSSATSVFPFHFAREAVGFSSKLRQSIANLHRFKPINSFN